jgi:hypothetical protein
MLSGAPVLATSLPPAGHRPVRPKRGWEIEWLKPVMPIKQLHLMPRSMPVSLIGIPQTWFAGIITVI